LVQTGASSRAAEDEIGGLLADHDTGRVGVAADEVRHDRGIGDAQALDAAHAQVRIDDRARVTWDDTAKQVALPGAGLYPIGVAVLAAGNGATESE
jgi:hypothetical protein